MNILSITGAATTSTLPYVILTMLYGLSLLASIECKNSNKSAIVDFDSPNSSAIRYAKFKLSLFVAIAQKLSTVPLMHNALRKNFLDSADKM